jgi:calmodulin
MADVGTVFEWYDPTKCGSINAGDLGTVLRMLGTTPTEKELSDAVGSDATITKGKVEELVSKYPKPSQTGTADALSAFDPNGTGKIELNELRHMLTNLGEKLDDTEVNDMIHNLTEAAEKESVNISSEPVDIKWLAAKIAG